MIQELSYNEAKEIEGGNPILILAIAYAASLNSVGSVGESFGEAAYNLFH